MISIQDRENILCHHTRWLPMFVRNYEQLSSLFLKFGLWGSFLTSQKMILTTCFKTWRGVSDSWEFSAKRPASHSESHGQSPESLLEMGMQRGWSREPGHDVGGSGDWEGIWVKWMNIFWQTLWGQTAFIFCVINYQGNFFCNFSLAFSHSGLSC